MWRCSTLIAILLAVGCSSPPPPTSASASRVIGLKDLLDSLVAESPCPRPGLPPIVGGAEFDSVVQCGLATAALRRLAREPAMEPRHAPGDTARVDTITILFQAWPLLDTAGKEAGVTDSVIQVQLDIRGRPRYFITYYSVGSIQSLHEQFGLIHR
jgi:hypothetical protein